MGVGGKVESREGTGVTQAYDRLKALLAELFQFDREDLDFGIYRIMSQKRDGVLVRNRGRIVERGTHGELTGGCFKVSWRLCGSGACLWFTQSLGCMVRMRETAF